MLRRTARLTAVWILSCASLAFGWGDDGHFFINRVAVRNIPASMPGFLKAAEDQIVYLAIEPDRWRLPADVALKQAQEPDHYIDLERVSWLSDFPPGRYDFYRLLYEKRAAAKEHADDFLPNRVGLQPYITMEVFERLKVAFREYRCLKRAAAATESAERSAVFYAGWLGHYVGDGSQPLHTTVNYDGWVEVNPRGYRTEPGLHGEFERAFVSRNIKLDDFASMVAAPHRLADPFHDYLKYLQTSHTFVERVYQLDKDGGFQGSGKPEARELVKQRLAAASQMLVDLWFTAWQDSSESDRGCRPPA